MFQRPILAPWQQISTSQSDPGFSQIPGGISAHQEATMPFSTTVEDNSSVSNIRMTCDTQKL